MFSRRTKFACAILTPSIVLGVQARSNEIPLKTWDFERDPTGRTPDGLSIRETHPGGAKGAWIVVSDPEAPSKPNILRLVTRAAEDTFNLALVEKPAFQDVDVRVRIRSDRGTVDQGGGMVWRCQDESNYYICRVNPLESNFRVYKVVDGKRSQLASAQIPTQAGRWYHVRAVMIGNSIQCYLDNHKLLEAADDTFKDVGMIGLWTKADASSSFDDFIVSPPPAASQPSSPPGGSP